MKSLAQIFLIGFILIHVRKVIAQRSLNLQLQNINCYSYAQEWIKTLNCELSERNHTSFVNANIILMKPLKQFNVNVVLEYFIATGTPVKIVDTNIDGCDYLKQSTKTKKNKIVQKYLTKFVNKLPVCPVESNFNYTLTELYIDLDDLPSQIPDCLFRIAFKVSEQLGTTVGLKVVVDGKLWRQNKANGK